MIDRVILTVADFMRSIRFYERALRPLGITDSWTSTAQMTTRI
jgi:hypothetical protein